MNLELRNGITHLINQKSGISGLENQVMQSLQSPRYEPTRLLAKDHIKSTNHILIIGPHPDDEEFTASTMMQLTGPRISYAFYTDGREGTGPYSRRYKLTQDQLIQMRVKEKIASIDHLASINRAISLVYIFSSPDMQLARYYEQAVAKTISFCRESNVDLIIFPNPKEDYHPDHLAAGEIGIAVAEALDITAYMHDTQFGKKWITPASLFLGEKYQQIDTQTYFESLIEQERYYEGDILITIPPSVMYETLIALRKHISQFTNTDFLSRIVKSKAIRGNWISLMFADTFTLAYQCTQLNGAMEHPFTLLLPESSIYQKVKN